MSHTNSDRSYFYIVQKSAYCKQSADAGRHSDCDAAEDSWFLIEQVRGTDVGENQLARDHRLGDVTLSWSEPGMWLW